MRVAVIGVGTVGKIHVDLLLDKGLGLIAICDTDIVRCAAYPQIKAYSDYREMITKEKPDVVHICTPHYLHAEMILYALNRNINVLCEKPLCIRKKDIPAILQAELKSTAQLGVCFQNRYLPRNAYVKKFLENETTCCAVATLAWERGKEYYNSAKWRGTKDKEGGGVLINQAIHTIDLLTWFMGMPEYITATVSNHTLQNVIEVEDTASLVCTGGAEFNVFATNGCKADFPIEIKLKTQNHMIRLFDDKAEVDGKIFSFENAGKFLGKACYGWGHAPLFDDFYDCIRTSRRFSLDGQEGAKAVKIVLAAYKSNGKKTKIND